MSASGSALQVLKTCVGLPWRTASWNREAFMRYPPRISPVVLLCVCHTSRGSKATGRRQNQWGRNSREMCVCLQEGQEGGKPKENIGGGSGFWYWSAPWGTADGWQRGWSQENHACKVPARANNTVSGNTGGFQGSCSDGNAKEFRVELEQSFSMNKSTPTYCCSPGAGWCCMRGNVLYCALTSYQGL